MENRETRAYVAELLGTFLLVLFICFVVSVNSAGVLNLTDFAVIGLLHFFVLAVLVATLGGISGCHLNPAVTLTVLALRKIKPSEAGVYIILQFAGAVLAALVVKAVLGDQGEPSAYGGVEISDRFDATTLAALVVEALGTFILVWAIVGTAVNRQVEYAPLLIGAALGLAVLAFAPLTGAGLNPARAFGPDFVAGTIDDIGWGTFLLVYFVGPIVGAVGAGSLHHYLIGEE